MAEQALMMPRVFQGSNGEMDIETLEEFLAKTKDLDVVCLKGWTFTQVDFTDPEDAIPKERWDAFHISGAQFWGCRFPKYTSVEEVIQHGAVVLQNPDPNEVPFVPFRAFMYRQEELRKHDAKIYEFFKQQCTNLSSLMMQTLHDHFIQDALLDYLESKTVIVVMGGHSLSRNSDDYISAVRMGWKLARSGFVVATGGGPGAMEAANLGAYLFERSESEVEDAIKLISTTPPGQVIKREFENIAAPQAVIDKYGTPTYAPSLGVPTWKYGHEPTNMFATWHAKMFSNAIREDGLIAIGNGGIIYFPGSSGTRQEVFQAACQNDNAEVGQEIPMVFYNSEFWNSCSIYEVLKKNSSDRLFARWLRKTDSTDDIVNFVKTFRDQANLPVVSIDDLKSKIWQQSDSSVEALCHRRRTECGILPKSKRWNRIREYNKRSSIF